jgi:transposase
MMEVTTVGLDITKHVFQVHGVDQDADAVLRRKLRRAEVVSFFDQRMKVLRKVPILSGSSRP